MFHQDASVETIKLKNIFIDVSTDAIIIVMTLLFDCIYSIRV